MRGVNYKVVQNMKFTFNVSGGQINVANNDAIINATQNNCVIKNDINELIKSIKENLSGISRKDAENIINIVEQVKSEFELPEPKKSRLRNCVTLLAPMITIANGIPILVSNLQKFQEMIIQYINA